MAHLPTGTGLRHSILQMAPAFATRAATLKRHLYWSNPISAPETLQCEMNAVEGAVPDRLQDALYDSGTYAISRDEFLLRVPNGLAYHYSRDRGVTYTRPETVTDAEVQLFLNGSVYGAVAWLNGFVPLHASAIVHDGRAYAFTGHSGAGKSTLAAALCRRGFRLLTDDVMVLATDGDGKFIALPGHGRFKLWKDALPLTDAEMGQRVRPEMEKFFAHPRTGSHPSPIPVACLYFLDATSLEKARTEEVKGSQAFDRIATALYRRGYHSRVYDKVQNFAMLKKLLDQVPLRVFDRPFAKDKFEQSLDLIEAEILGKS